MICWLHSALILVLVLTGVALGAARGQARIAGQVVICSGNAVAVIEIDQDGKPVQSAHFCPDMALAMLAAVATGADAPVPVRRTLRVSHVTQRALADWQAVLTVRARGPPVGVHQI